jgi:pyrimidine-nucleoside phosphorylase
MLPYSLIEKKQAGKALTRKEWEFFISGYLSEDIPAYQMSAMLMAIYFRGLEDEEVSNLIDIVIKSGKRIHFKHKDVFYADKHSTGGVGDKISLILAPLAAASGRVRVPMISGRALGHSGGTLDKLESIPGFRTHLTLKEFQEQTDRIGCALIGQTNDICPADRELYALRDVTATVRSIPLICISILSKKIAEGIQGLVVDVKSGNGAFMQTKKDAKILASKLKHFGEAGGLKVTPVITDMNQPLGKAVGNWLEVRESLDVLHGGGPRDVRDLSIRLTEEMILLAEPNADRKAIRTELASLLDNGKAFDKFLEIVKAQEGDISVLENPDTYPKPDYVAEVTADKTGIVQSIDTYGLGLDAIDLGAGRRKSTDTIDPKAGMLVHISIGDKVSPGDPFFTLFSDNEKALKKKVKEIGERVKLRMENGELRIEN